MIDGSIVVELGQVREIPQHMHGGIEIYLVLRGNINLTTDGKKHFLRQDDIVLCNYGEPHSAVGATPNITLRVQISEEFLHQETGKANVHFHCNSCQMTEKERELVYGQLRLMLIMLAHANYRKNEYMPIDFKSETLRMVSFLLKHFQSEQKKASPRIDNCSDERVLKIIRRINKDYNTDISLHDIAEEEHLSVHYLSRLFKKKTGEGFMEYLGQLRLAGAVNHLLHTDWPIIKIALTNGFSNVGSFNKLFMRKYGQSPAKYRTTRKVSSLPMESEMVEAFNNADELARYLGTFEAKFEETYSENVRVEINAEGAVIDRFNVIGRIIRFGHMAELLKSEVQQQLRAARERVLAEYAHFICLHKDGMYKYQMSEYSDYEYFQVLDFLHSIGIKPFFNFSVQAFLDETADPSPEKFGEEISNFLESMTAHFNSEYTGTWMFEIDYTPSLSREALWEYYRSFVGAIWQVLPAAQLGLQFIEHITDYKEDYSLFAEHMKRAESEKIMPSFITYYSNWWELEEYIVSSENYELYRDYIATMVGNLAQFLRTNGLEMPRVLLMEWNVLTGFTTVESNAFFRSALYADGFLNLEPHITDVAYWINAYVHETYHGKAFFEVPSLFLFADLKRSIFFSLTVLDQTHTEVIYRDDNIVVTKNGSDELSILVMNACYFAPRLALDDIFVDSLRRIFSIQLENIRGEKVIERYHLDSERTSLYNRWVRMGLPPFVNRNVIEQLNGTTNAEYAYFEERLDGSYIFSVALDFNELAIITIRNKHQ